MLIGTNIDCGRMGVSIISGETTFEEGVRYIVDNAPNADESMVRTLLESILPVIQPMKRGAFLKRLEGIDR